MEEQKKLEKLKAWVDQQADISNKESLDMNGNLSLRDEAQYWNLRGRYHAYCKVRDLISSLSPAPQEEECNCSCHTAMNGFYYSIKTICCPCIYKPSPSSLPEPLEPLDWDDFEEPIREGFTLTGNGVRKLIKAINHLQELSRKA